MDTNFDPRNPESQRYIFGTNCGGERAKSLDHDPSVINGLQTELYHTFYHDVGEISDLSQSEAPNLVMWRVMVMQPRPRLLGDEVVVGPNLMFRKMDPWNVIRNILQDKTDKNQL